MIGQSIDQPLEQYYYTTFVLICLFWMLRNVDLFCWVLIVFEVFTRLFLFVLDNGLFVLILFKFCFYYGFVIWIEGYWGIGLGMVL